LGNSNPQNNYNINGKKNIKNKINNNNNTRKLKKQ